MKTPDGREIETNREGKATVVRTPSGAEAHLNNGRITSVHKVGPNGSSTDIHNGPGGVRTIKTVERDSFGHSIRTVSDGHRGYRERELSRRPGYRQRTYFDHGHTYARIYHDRVYGRYGAYPVYVPAYYYSPGYYAWFGAPWGVSVSFGWGSSPGYAMYGGYFAPPATYASPDAWMADYIINENLNANAAAQQDAQQDAAADGVASGDGGDAAQPQPIPQAVRDAYTQQVQTTVQAEQAEAAGQPVADDAPGALSPKFLVFQSYSDVEATDLTGQTCQLTGGDFVHRDGNMPDASKTVIVTVMTVAKPSQGHCMVNGQVRLSVDTLQDWYNSFTASQQAGFEAMNANAGKNGIPAAPSAGKVANPAGQGTPDDANAMASAIQEQQSGASAVQAEVTGGGQ